LKIHEEALPFPLSDLDLCVFSSDEEGGKQDGQLKAF
jgi:hypothetical protein